MSSAAENSPLAKIFPLTSTMHIQYTYTCSSIKNNQSIIFMKKCLKIMVILFYTINEFDDDLYVYVNTAKYNRIYSVTISILLYDIKSFLISRFPSTFFN
jgi:hypothetical protein